VTASLQCKQNAKAVGDDWPMLNREMKPYRLDFFEETPIPASVDMPTATLHYQTAFTR
jgi:hypothetical protein